jgi:hypothetical protein
MFRFSALFALERINAGSATNHDSKSPKATADSLLPPGLDQRSSAQISGEIEFFLYTVSAP